MNRQLVTFFAIAAMGCTAAVETPALPMAVVGLAGAYEQPSAILTPESARAVVVRTQPLREILQAVRGLQFIRGIVENATSIRDADIDSLDVRGELDARAACPGWSDITPPDQAVDGTLEVTIGVEDSRVQRAFGGRAVDCRFVTQVAGQNLNAVATMDLEVDLGSSLGLGERARAILVRATNLSGSVGNIALNAGPDVLSFRLLEDGSIDSLLDLATLEAGLSGSVLLRVARAGAVALRARDGDWTCPEGGSACTRAVAP